MLKEDLIDRAFREIKKGDAERVYFLERAGPAWIKPMYLQGFFQNPPKPIRQAQYISSPPWPESRYLARMSAIPEAQTTVLEIVLSMPATDNAWVNEDLADVALNLPPQHSARLVHRVCQWVQGPIMPHLPDKIGDLIARLAEGGEYEAALALARVALSFEAGPAATEEEESILWPEPKPRLQTFYYDRIVERARRALVAVAGLDAIRLFSDILDQLISFSLRPSDTGDEDYLYHKQAEIEAMKDPNDPASVALCALRDAAEQLVRQDRSQFSRVVADFRAKRWDSFRRLELHLSRVFPEEGLALAEEFFRDPENLDRIGLRHEAVLLLKSSFKALTADTQERVLRWMDQELPAERCRFWLEATGESVTEENVRALSDIHRRDHFAVLKDQLPSDYEHKLAELVARFGEGRPLEESPSFSGGGFGPRSPKSVEELSQMEMGEILSFLAAWVPGADPFPLTAEGLGRNLTAVVTARPDEFVAIADRFRELDPTYIRCFLAGLTEAIKQNKVFHWRPVLELAGWVVSQPREIEDRKAGLMVADPDWGWTRTAIVDLITAGLADTPARLACTDRALVWGALKPLTDDPSPSLEDETGTHFDPAHLSINSTRGRALYAVVKYAWWVRACGPDDGLPPITFAEMPEVQEVLDTHLNPEVDPTLTVRAVYGESIPSLAGLDRDWLESNLSRILPDEDENNSRFVAAWESFVVFRQAYAHLMPLLEPAYRRAIGRIGKPGLLRQPASPDSRLSEHLMVYYWWGKLDLDANGLLDTFYEVAPGQLRAHAMWFTKHFLCQVGASAEASERLRNLMGRRLEAAGRAQSPEDFSQELAMFGYWFAEGNFDERWALDTLLATLRLAKKIQDEVNVVKRLAELGSKYPLECVECLRMVIQGAEDRWAMPLIEASARDILTLAMRSDIPQAVLDGRRLAQDLIKSGNYEFRALL